MSNNINIEKEISNTATGEELKKKFRKKAKIPLKEFTLRLFFAGNEIKNEHMLYQHKLENDYKIQVMKIQKTERRKSKKLSRKSMKENNNIIVSNEDTEG